jgi:phosphoheptose isomerase
VNAAKATLGNGVVVVFLGPEGDTPTDLNTTFKIGVPGDCSARIQEAHLAIGHIMCERIEAILG